MFGVKLLVLKVYVVNLKLHKEDKRVTGVLLYF